MFWFSRMKFVGSYVRFNAGKRVFRDDGVRRAFRLVDGKVTGAGAILAKSA